MYVCKSMLQTCVSKASCLYADADVVGVLRSLLDSAEEAYTRACQS